MVSKEKRIKIKSNDNSTVLNDAIVELIQDKKGHSIISIDLREVQEAIVDYYIICHGDSTTQVKAIIDNIHKKAKELWGETPHHIEGMREAQWAIIDYMNVVVHVFLKDVREYYQLEDLWSDGVIKKYEENY